MKVLRYLQYYEQFYIICTKINYMHTFLKQNVMLVSIFGHESESQFHSNIKFKTIQD